MSVVCHERCGEKDGGRGSGCEHERSVRAADLMSHSSLCVCVCVLAASQVYMYLLALEERAAFLIFLHDRISEKFSCGRSILQMVLELYTGRATWACFGEEGDGSEKAIIPIIAVTE